MGRLLTVPQRTQKSAHRHPGKRFQPKLELSIHQDMVKLITFLLFSRFRLPDVNAPPEERPPLQSTHFSVKRGKSATPAGKTESCCNF